jgi:predicted RNase H-like nuclease (RuvC/YqgF family)
MKVASIVDYLKEFLSSGGNEQLLADTIQDMNDSGTEYKSKVSELESELDEVKSEKEKLETERDELQEQVDMAENYECDIDCQSGGGVRYELEGVNMKVEMIFDALKEYLQAGKNEQALIDFLEA